MSENKEKSGVQLDWGKIMKVAAILLIITLVCTLLLAFTNSITAPIIAKQNEAANTKAQQEVLPDADKFEEVSGLSDKVSSLQSDYSAIITTAYAGYKGDQIVGYAIKTTPSGYGGDIEMLTGVSTDGKVTGISILSQSETAGLGAKSTDPAFSGQYKGLSAEEDVTVVKGQSASGNQIEAITGATITSKAVTLGVNAADAAAKVLMGESK
ncbi:MAG: RnfABCDGE type electron transport complex subunit G [Eubacteriaceae bacterium]|jgi:electron transport complex protein RnfG